MFERDSHPSRRAVFLAWESARDAGAAEIDSMHLLSALTLEASSRANVLFRLNQRFPEEVTRMRAMKVSSETRNHPLATDCKRVLAYTAQEADRLGDYWINTDHLVLGILRDHENAAAARLEASGLQIVQARTHVSSGRERGNYFFLRSSGGLRRRPISSGTLLSQPMCY